MNLKTNEDVKRYLISASKTGGADSLVDAIRTVIKDWGPTKISEVAGGSKQKWGLLKNPTYQTISDFLSAFDMKVVAAEKK